ncbi:hypothetical protein [Halomonas sp. Y3]|uniref:hypothetical protein n=1 Tax=Halomonas sp. Y3 TaxID=2956797 RepID=UPI00209E07C4|nr:hypothetical protein [Halomonas sp. Y3]
MWVSKAYGVGALTVPLSDDVDMTALQKFEQLHRMEFHPSVKIAKHQDETMHAHIF